MGKSGVGGRRRTLFYLCIECVLKNSIPRAMVVSGRLRGSGLSGGWGLGEMPWWLAGKQVG